MASDMIDSDMAGTTISRQIGVLVQLNKEKHMACTVRIHVYKAKHGKIKFIGCMDH